MSHSNADTIRFEAKEYHSDGTLVPVDYEYTGSTVDGWVLRRNGTEFQRLGPGYTPVNSRYCGVCSTDLARCYLPYPLPQVIGHEVVGHHDGRDVVVEINASHRARGIAAPEDPFAGEMHPHDPRRITLGIDRLPGGFAPVMLAPVDAIVPVPANVSPLVAALTEPFAAALQGVESTHPRPGDRVAVLGPRRLGSLIIAALAGFRRQSDIDFEIVAVARHQHLIDLCRKLGADEGVLLEKTPTAPSGEGGLNPDTALAGQPALRESFDIVYDTTGQPAGFAAALALSRRVVHVKSTNGQPVLGLRTLTDMVVDEIALLPARPAALDFTWPTEEKPRANRNVYLAPGTAERAGRAVETLREAAGPHRLHATAPERVLRDLSEMRAIDRNDPDGPGLNETARPEYLNGSPYPRFDLAVAASLREVDAIVRPRPGEEFALLRARGAVLLAAPDDGEYDSPLHRAVAERGLEIHTSRCGNFERALKILSAEPEIAAALEEHLITHQIPLDRLDEAFAVAADSSASVKVVVETGSPAT